MTLVKAWAVATVHNGTMFGGDRLDRERSTVVAMIRLYCRDNHPGEDLCGDCADLVAYAEKRLSRCPFEADKPVCNKCPIHCYRPEIRERVKAVMRYSGPRMLLSHPILAVRHMIDAHREAPPPSRRPSA